MYTHLRTHARVTHSRTTANLPIRWIPTRRAAVCTPSSGVLRFKCMKISV